MADLKLRKTVYDFYKIGFYERCMHIELFNILYSIFILFLFFIYRQFIFPAIQKK